MNVTLLAATEVDSQLEADFPVLRGVGTPQENLIEYSGRICYRSDDKMGRNPGFINARVREGHEDIIEHVRFVFKVEGLPLDRSILILVSLPTVEYTDLGGDAWIFSLNARNIRDYYVNAESPLAAGMVRLARDIIPSVYSDLAVSESAK